MVDFYFSFCATNDRMFSLSVSKRTQLWSISTHVSEIACCTTLLFQWPAGRIYHACVCDAQDPKSLLQLTPTSSHVLSSPWRVGGTSALVSTFILFFLFILFPAPPSEKKPAISWAWATPFYHVTIIVQCVIIRRDRSSFTRGGRPAHACRVSPLQYSNNYAVSRIVSTVGRVGRRLFCSGKKYCRARRRFKTVSSSWRWVDPLIWSDRRVRYYTYHGLHVCGPRRARVMIGGRAGGRVHTIQNSAWSIDGAEAQPNTRVTNCGLWCYTFHFYAASPAKPVDCVEIRRQLKRAGVEDRRTCGVDADWQL